MSRKRRARQIIISSFDNPANPHYRGGGAAVVEMVAARLATEFDVTVITAAPRGGTRVANGVRYRKLPLGWAGPRGGQLLYHMLMPFAAWRLPHDLWIENFTPPFTTGFLPLFSRSRVVGLAQTMSGEEMSARYRLPFSRVERFGMRFYRDVIVLNPADRALVTSYNPDVSTHLIPNGIELRSLDERQLGRGEHILFLGRIDIRKKGLDLLLEAYQQAQPGLPLIIAGAGTPTEERRFGELLAAAGPNVSWLGYVDGPAKQDLLKRSAFVIMPSRYETFGLAALEAMSFGKPVIHFDLATLSWIGGGVRVPPFAVDALAARISDLVRDEKSRRALGRTAHATAQRFGGNEASGRYLSLVRELLAS